MSHELEPGFTYNLLLDFDVDKSVVIAGNSGNINLKPVIRASILYVSGKIQGVVTPFDFQIMASVMVTQEDVIETLLGLEIMDESDNVADLQKLTRKGWETRAKRLGLIVEKKPGD